MIFYAQAASPGTISLISSTEDGILTCCHILFGSASGNERVSSPAALNSVNCPRLATKNEYKSTTHPLHSIRTNLVGMDPYPFQQTIGIRRNVNCSSRLRGETALLVDLRYSQHCSNI